MLEQNNHKSSDKMLLLRIRCLITPSSPISSPVMVRLDNCEVWVCRSPFILVNNSQYCFTLKWQKTFLEDLWVFTHSLAKQYGLWEPAKGNYSILKKLRHRTKKIDKPQRSHQTLAWLHVACFLSKGYSLFFKHAQGFPPIRWPSKHYCPLASQSCGLVA